MIKKIIAIIIIFLIVFALFNLSRQISVALQAGNRLDQTASQLSDLQNKNRQLRSQLGEVQKNDFIEQQARDKLNFTKSNETIVIIPDDLLKNVLGDHKQLSELQLPNWQGWLKLFSH